MNETPPEISSPTYVSLEQLLLREDMWMGHSQRFATTRTAVSTGHADLVHLRNDGFVRIAGIVTGKQRPGTASGVMFLSLEDETGTSNIIIWRSTQERFRKEILTGKLLVIKGTVQVATEGVAVPIVHIVAGHIQNVTDRLQSLALESRDFH